jgi:hypothetical protein
MMCDNMSSKNIPLARLVNEKREGFSVYLVPEDKRKYHDLYLLKTKGSTKKDEFYMYLREWEVIELVAVLTSGIAEKKRRDYRRYRHKHNRRS